MWLDRHLRRWEITDVTPAGHAELQVVPRGAHGMSKWLTSKEHAAHTGWTPDAWWKGSEGRYAQAHWHAGAKWVDQRWHVNERCVWTIVYFRSNAGVVTAELQADTSELEGGKTVQLTLVEMWLCGMRPAGEAASVMMQLRGMA